MRRALIACLLFAYAVDARADCERVSVWRAGTRTAVMCRAEATARGLTVIDLGEDWLPPILSPPGPSYAATYLALAQERFDDAGLDGTLAKRDRYLELFGIVPTLGVIRGRLADDARHACHAAIDNAALATTSKRITEETTAEGRARLARARVLRSELEHDRVRAKLADLEALAATSRYYRRAVDRLTTLEARIAAVRAIQAHLACDGLATTFVAGAYTWHTSNAIEAFQRGAMILPTGTVDIPTRDALLLDSRERDLRAALRVLRTRVVAAAGLIEDGTAGSGEGTVLGRALEPDATCRVRGHDPLPEAAGDSISAATETAAIALGWRDASSVRAFLDGLLSGETSGHLVAIQLPRVPAYHASDMELSVEIDRADGSPTRRPALILYANAADRRIPLVRWPTTVGGWQNENVGGVVEKRWKESPLGPRIWRDLYVGPRWLPPLTTPDRELVRRSDNHHYVLAREQLGPSYRAAFGLVAFIHLVEVHGETWDEGIRTHGTGNLTSLANGASHGCHRLLGDHVVRLADFILAHHHHVRRGDTPTFYRRVVRAGDDQFRIAIDTLGYRIELDPPIRVDVLRGP